MKNLLSLIYLKVTEKIGWFAIGYTKEEIKTGQKILGKVLMDYRKGDWGYLSVNLEVMEENVKKQYLSYPED